MIHVDSLSGSNDKGSGTKENPYQSLAHAIFIHGPSESFSIRSGSDSSGAGAGAGEYTSPTPTALKKAKKDAEILQRKAKKAAEQGAEEQANKALERERVERRLEESKKVVLKEDLSLSKPIRVSYVQIHTLFVDDIVWIGKDCSIGTSSRKESLRIWMGPSS
jgi:asparaginyl-tRNA synthetase